MCAPARARWRASASADGSRRAASSTSPSPAAAGRSIRAPRFAKALAASLIPEASAVSSGPPHFLVAHPSIAAPKFSSNSTSRAAAELAEARRLGADDRYSSIARFKAVVGYFGVPKIRALFEATLFVGLRNAGMPEE
jgi:hypothetical protein